MDWLIFNTRCVVIQLYPLREEAYSKIISPWWYHPFSSRCVGTDILMFEKPTSSKKRIVILFSWINVKENGRAIKNGQSKTTGNIRHTRHGKKTNKTQKTTADKDEQHRRHQKPDETSCSRKVSSSCLLFVLQVFLTSMYIDIVYLLICLFHVHRCCLFTDMSISGVNEYSP